MTTQTCQRAQQPSRYPDAKERMRLAAQQTAADPDLPLGQNLGILIQNHDKGMVTVAYQLPDERE